MLRVNVTFRLVEMPRPISTSCHVEILTSPEELGNLHVKYCMLPHVDNEVVIERYRTKEQHRFMSFLSYLVKS